MSKKKKPRQLGRKAWVEPEMMVSEVFRSLSGTAMWVLLRFIQKCEWSTIRLNGKKLKFIRQTASRSPIQKRTISDSQMRRFTERLKCSLSVASLMLSIGGEVLDAARSRTILALSYQTDGKPGESQTLFVKSLKC